MIGLVRAFNWHIEIFRLRRSPETPVGLATATGTEDESIALTNLRDIDEEQVNMRTVVIIGNSATKAVGCHMITSRGYAL